MTQLSFYKFREDKAVKAAYLKLYKDLSKKRITNKKIAVILHLFYPDMWDKIYKHLNLIGRDKFDLFVSVPQDNLEIIESIKTNFPDAEIFVVPNRGRDVLPFLMTAASIRHLNHSVIIKIHSKKSKHRTDGGQWMDAILNNLIPSHATLRDKIIEAALNSETGLIGPAEQYFSLNVNFEANGVQMTRYLSRVIGKNNAYSLLQVNRQDYGFFAGTMFWITNRALEPILDNMPKIRDFDLENGQIDGTFAHALERLFCVIPEHNKRVIYGVQDDSIAKLSYNSGIVPDWSDVYLGPKK